MYEDYRIRCQRGEIRAGQVTTFREKERLIINFPTKGHWRNPSRLEDIDAGLDALHRLIRAQGLRHVALPPLGCGNGGLAWSHVRQSIERTLGDLEGVRIEVYEPRATFSSPVAREPRLSLAHIVLASLRTGLDQAKAITLQKAAYFFNLYSGESYFRFTAHKYGPYCAALDPMQRQIRDYLDYHRMTVAEMLGDATNRKLAGRDVDRLRRLDPAIRAATALCNRLGRSVEAVATVHAVLAERGDTALDDIVEAFFAWSPEKRERFQRADVISALERVEQEGLGQRTLLGYRASSPPSAPAEK
jgi:hypothetical protein